MVTPKAKRAALAHLREAHRMSERRACRLLGASRSTMRYASRRRDPEALLTALKALAGRHRRFGYRRLTRLLRRRMGRVNHKRVYRLYRKHGLQVPVRRRRRRSRMPRQPMTAPRRRNECCRWTSCTTAR